MSTDQLIRITSWNVAGKDPMINSPMLDYLFDDSKRLNETLRPEIQIVGLQEAPQYLFSDPWTSNLSSTLHRRGYILFKRHKLSGILLYIFVLREILLRARDFETESVKTGFGGLLGNKGGVCLRFTLNGNSVAAMNSHLAAHQENLQQRVQDYYSILEGTRFTIDNNTISVLNHDYTFWFGDLNFRLDNIEKHEVLNIITKARTTKSKEESAKIISALHRNDQLISVRKKGQAFVGFQENEPRFLPTYKFVIGSKDAYDSEQRIPAWTDRILFKTKSAEAIDFKAENQITNFNPKLEQMFYDALTETDLSDHKPIVSMFRLSTYDPKVYNPSQVPYEPVKFEPITGWKASEDGRLWYKISDELFYRRPKVLSSWDRLALYKSDFKSLDDYLTVVFVNNIARVSPQLNAQEVPYLSSTPSTPRSNTPSGSRRGSTSSVSSSSSAVSVAVDAMTLLSNRSTSPASTSSVQPVLSAAKQSAPGPDEAQNTSIVNSPSVGSLSQRPENVIVSDGFKYFSSTFPDDVLIPGQYTVLYLKTTSANEYNVYGMSEPFTVT